MANIANRIHTPRGVLPLDLRLTFFLGRIFLVAHSCYKEHLANYVYLFDLYCSNRVRIPEFMSFVIGI